MTPLESAIAQLENSIEAIRASGRVAQHKSRIEVSPHSKTGKLYARLVTGNRRGGLGREGSDKHLEAIASIERREAINYISETLTNLRAHLRNPEWNPPQQLEVNQNKYIEPAQHEHGRCTA